jgi:hypothetical protein
MHGHSVCYPFLNENDGQLALIFWHVQKNFKIKPENFFSASDWSHQKSYSEHQATVTGMIGFQKKKSAFAT